MIKKTKKTSLLITGAIITSLSIVAFAPSALAFGSDGKKGQQTFNQMHQKAHAQEQTKRGGKMGQRGGAKGGQRGGFVNFACSDEAASKMEEGLNRISEKFELTSEQQEFFDGFKTASLSAQTQFSDNCNNPEDENDASFIEKIKAKQSNMANGAIAMNEVIPELEAFINSLTDEQKAKLKKGKRGEKKPNYK